jgi:hypothetical protein
MAGDAPEGPGAPRFDEPVGEQFDEAGEDAGR